MKIVFFGTPAFSAEILKYLVEKGLDVVAVVTQPDKIQGRHLKLQEPAVKKMAQSLSLNVPILQPKKITTEDFRNSISAFEADLFVVVAFGQIFPESILELPRLKCINVHTSLLPKYRGAAPIQRCLMEGELETGVSIMYMVKELDAGDVLASQVLPIDSKMNAHSLAVALCEISKKLLYDTIVKLDQGKINAEPQNHKEATYAKKVTPKDAEISWDKTAIEILRQFRGVTPKPGAWTAFSLRGKQARLKILDLILSPLEGAPGEVLAYGSKGIVVACKEGAIKIIKLQIEGKKPLIVEEFVKGYSSKDLSFNVPTLSEEK